MDRRVDTGRGRCGGGPTRVVVTGGGSEVGRATARAFIARGAQVVLGDVDRAGVRAAAEALGHGTVGRWLDVTDPDDFARFLDAIEIECGPIDVLVNHAGLVRTGRFEHESESASRAVVEVNLFGVLHGTRLALRRMKARGRGHIVNVAWVADAPGAPVGATYAATQHAVAAFTAALRVELAETGVEVSCVNLGRADEEVASYLPVVAPHEVARHVVRVVERSRDGSGIVRTSPRARSNEPSRPR